MKIKHKTNIFLLLLFLVNAVYSQELKIIDAYGNPVKSKTVILNNTFSDTLETNSRGKIKIRKNTDYQSITILEYNTIVSKDSIKNGVLQISNSETDALPTFETKTTNHSHILNNLKEFDHETITKEKILNSDYSTSADILLLTDGVTIQKSQGGGGSPIIRGFEANRILLMIDGVRMNNAIYRNGHVQNSLTVDPFIIEDFNIIYGPSAVTYGSDAIGGVINYITTEPKLSNKKDSTLEKIRFITRLNKGADELTNHVDFNFGKQKWASFSSLTFKQFGDIVMGKNRKHGYADWGKVPYSIYPASGADSLIINPNPDNQPNIGYDQIDVTQKFLFKPTQHLEISTNSQLSTSSNIQRFDQLNNYNENGIPQFATWEYGPQLRIMNVFNLNWKKLTPLFDDISLNASYQQVSESRNIRQFNNPYLEQNNEQVQVFGVNICANRSLTETLSLTYGGEVYFNDIWSTGKRTNIYTQSDFSHLSRYPSGGSGMIMQGYYGMVRWQKEKLSVVSGVRYALNKINGQFNDYIFGVHFEEINVNNNALNGSFHISYYPNTKTKYNFSLSTGFRSPNVDDLGKIFNKDGFITVPNVNLIPEYAYNSSLGLTKTYLIRNENSLKVKWNGFGTLLNNMIIKDDFHLNNQPYLNWNGVQYAVLANRNTNQGLVYGVNHSLELRIRNLQIKYALNYTKGIITYNATPVGHIPPITGNFFITLTEDEFTFSVFSLFNGVKNRNNFGPGNVDNPFEATDSGYPSWYTLNARISSTINSKLNLAINLNNIFDVHYKTFASGISAPGRNLGVTLKLVY